jgi:hypothetical protein
MKQQLYLKLPNRGRCALGVFCLMFILPIVTGISVAQTTAGGDAGQTTESSNGFPSDPIHTPIRITATY